MYQPTGQLYLTIDSNAVIYRDMNNAWHLWYSKSTDKPACYLEPRKNAKGETVRVVVADASVKLRGNRTYQFQGADYVTVLNGTVFNAMVGIINSRERIKKPMDLVKFGRAWGINVPAGKVFTDGVTGKFFIKFKKNDQIQDLLFYLGTQEAIFSKRSDKMSSTYAHVTYTDAGATVSIGVHKH